MSTRNITAPQTYYKTPAEVLDVQCDFTPLLREGEVLTGTPTATVSGSDSVLTESGVAITTAVSVILGATVDAGKAITFTASAGTNGVTYSILVSCGTSTSAKRQYPATIIVSTT